MAPLGQGQLTSAQSTESWQGAPAEAPARGCNPALHCCPPHVLGAAVFIGATAAQAQAAAALWHMLSMHSCTSLPLQHAGWQSLAALHGSPGAAPPGFGWQVPLPELLLISKRVVGDGQALVMTVRSLMQPAKQKSAAKQ